MNLHRGDMVWLGALMMGCLAIQSVGCSGGSGAPDVYPVTGVVTRGGKPVEGAVVAFVPTAADGEKAIGGQAQSGADGKFTVQATINAGHQTLEGLPAGEYKVTVTKMEMPAGAPSMARPPKNVLPPEYAMPESTPVTANVTAEGANEVTIPL